MCFNGTTHFPGDALKQYLERIGVKFGENLNAYTAIDETVYNISNVPVKTPGVVGQTIVQLSNTYVLVDRDGRHLLCKGLLEVAA